MRKTLLEAFHKLSAWHVLPAAFVVSLVVGLKSAFSCVHDLRWFWLWMTTVLFVGFWAASSYISVKQLSLKSCRSFLRTHRWEIAGVIFLTLLAFGIRVIHLSTIPHPFGADEAAYALAAFEVNDGFVHNPFTTGMLGHPALYSFVLAPFHWFFETRFAQRLLSVLFGTLAVPLLYLLLRAMWGKSIAFGAALYLAGYHLHHHYSRIGINNIQTTFLAVLAFFFVWRATEKEHTSDFVLAGLTAALSMYAYLGSRIVIVFVFLFLCFTMLGKKAFLRENVRNLLFMALAFCIVALPLFLYWYADPSQIMPRLDHTVFQSPQFSEQLASGKNVFSILGGKLVESFGFFTVLREHAWKFYAPPIPWVDFLSRPFFLIGMLWSLLRFWRPRHFFLLLLFFGTLVGAGVLTTGPYSGRFLAAVPAVSAWIVLGVVRVCDFLKAQRSKFVPIIIGVLVLYNLWFYFGVYVPGEYYETPGSKSQEALSTYVDLLPQNMVLFFFGAPRVSTAHPPFLLHFRTHSYFDVYPEGNITRACPSRLYRYYTLATPLPPHSSARAFLFYENVRADELEHLLDSCPNGTLITKNDSKGKRLFASYEFSANTSCLPQSASLTPASTTMCVNAKETFLNSLCSD